MSEFLVAETSLETGTTLIEASAGTGKTYTITGIVVRLIAQLGIPIQEILITTYTEAATAELRERVRDKIESTLKALEEGPGGDPFLAALLPRLDADTAHQALQDALRDFDEAAIHTIHSFCSRVLREHAFETGVAFDAKLIEDDNDLRLECAQDYWRQHFYEAPALLVATALHGKLSPEKLLELYAGIASHPAAIIRPEISNFAEAKKEMVHLVAEFRGSWAAWRDEVRAIFLTHNDWANQGMKEHEVRDLINALDSISEVGDALPAAFKALEMFTEANVSEHTCRRPRKETPHSAFMEFCTRYAAIAGGLREMIAADFIGWVREELLRRKVALGVMTYDDLLAHLHSALEGSNGDVLAERLSTRLRVALVDEFQDTDPIQTGIFRRVFARPERRLFLIGDPKQAIYGFRGADVLAYLGVKDWVDRTYSLGENQRSVARLVEGVNTLFQRPKVPFIDDRIAFWPVKAAGRRDRMPLLFEGKMRAPLRFSFYESEEIVSKTEIMSEIPLLVAGELVRLLQSGATIGTGEERRKVTPGDCAVLCRDNRHAQAIQQALGSRGIPAVVLSNANVIQSVEAGDLNLILTSLAEPKREDYLRAAIGTQTMGFTTARMDALQFDTAGWDNLCNRWQGYHARWVGDGFVRMFTDLMQLEKVRLRLLGLPDGERRVTNLQHLAELLQAAADKEHLTPKSLLQWWKRQITEGGITKEKEMRLDRDDSAVNVVTIHKSKGLEYPIVFCPLLWTGPSRGRKKKPLRFYGARDQMIYDLRSEHDVGDIELAKNQAFAEESRLLYVALTRAQYECHIIWGNFGKESSKKRDAEICPLLHLLEPVPDGRCDFSTVSAQGNSLDGEALRNTLKGLVASAPDVFSMEPLVGQQGSLFSDPDAKNELLPPRSFTGKIDRSWRVSSFSGLIAGADAVEADHDQGTSVPSSDLVPSGIHAFPKGTKAGVCLHEILEEVDFQNPAQIAPLVSDKLDIYGFNPALHQSVVGMIQRTLEVELSGSGKGEEIIRLGDIARTSALSELEFYFPTERLEPSQLNEFAGAGLAFEPRYGVLKGFIDLVFEQGGRFHIADWKSNWLGPDAESYDHANMAAAMQHHHYNLQSHLYTFALHRHLRQRLKDYNPQKHLGDVFYLFIRGINPARPEMGVFRATPPAAAIEKLERIFGGVS